MSKIQEELIAQCEAQCAKTFHKIEQTSLVCQQKVLDAFRKYKVAQRHFSGTTGYGYDDIGRDTLNLIFAEIFGTEAALVSPSIAGGTHAITIALFGLLKSGEKMLSVTSSPYDTLMPVIVGEGNGSLKDYGIGYRQTELIDGKIDFDAVKSAVLEDKSIKLIFIQRSKGYNWRDAMSAEEIGAAAKTIKSFRSDLTVLVDNCYGEFTETAEPTSCGADLAVGSLIKNIGGGLAPTGGYIVGSQTQIDRIASRLTAPGVGAEVGSYAYGYQLFYQGLFMAPHVVAQALKGSCLAGRIFTTLGYSVLPKAEDPMYDIIRSIKFETSEQLIAFCQAIQAASPVDSFVCPEPWDMPGYEHRVIMAAGTFVGGASIELSCDSPIKEPYIAYLQGGLTYEHVKIALKECLKRLEKV